MKYYIDNQTTYNGLYVGLMTNTSTPSEGDQIGAGITEIAPAAPTESGYERQFITSWGTTAGNDPILSGTSVTFNVSGIWEDVEGYFVSIGSGSLQTDALWAEVFPTGKGGDKQDGDRIIILPKYEQQSKGEV
jgi:hypothetical protein